MADILSVPTTIVKRDYLGHGPYGFKHPPDAGKVVITMPHGVILEHKLAREWRVGVERYRSCAIELLIAESPDRSRG
jgi:hypothetical protein